MILKRILFLLIALNNLVNLTAFSREYQIPSRQQKYKDTMFQQAYSVKYLVNRWKDKVTPSLNKVYCGIDLVTVAHLSQNKISILTNFFFMKINL